MHLFIVFVEDGHMSIMGSGHQLGNLLSMRLSGFEIGKFNPD